MISLEKAKMKNELEPYGVLLEPLSVEETNLKYKYTGQERDQSTGYDYMHFRYYSSNIGRFLKPDNVTGSPMNPQNWNLYSYVRGNPVNFNDPTGHQGEETNAKLPQSGGDPNAQVEAKEQIKEEQSENKDKESNKPPQKVGDELKDDVFKLTLDVSGLAATATDKAANPKLSAAGEKAAEEWGLILKQPEFKIAGKALSWGAALGNASGIVKDVWKPRSLGTTLSKEERISAYIDLTVGGTLLISGAVLEGPTIGWSSIPLAVGAGKFGTALGKLINASDFSKPIKTPSSNYRPGLWDDWDVNFFNSYH